MNSLHGANPYASEIGMSVAEEIEGTRKIGSSYSQSQNTIVTDSVASSKPRLIETIRTKKVEEVV